MAVSPTHRPPLPPGKTPGTHFCYGPSRPQGHSAAGRTKSVKNLTLKPAIPASDRPQTLALDRSATGIGRKQTRDLPVCSAVPQTIALPRTS